MLDLTITWDWLAFAVRWTHVITAIAWIGSSFYFIALDLGLRRTGALPHGVAGEEWQVHGGGFYHINKYMIAPDGMPEHLTWFKWEAYSTWLSGAALLMVLYWAGAELYLIDPAKADLAVWQAIALSAASLAIGWLVYDLLCKSALGNQPTLLMLLLFVVLAGMSWGYNEVFTGRAALLHLGAFTATIMTANVFLIIMPNQRIVVADLKAGRTPDGKYGKIAKLRSTHNNYLTLPVIFLMVSNHYPLAFGTAHAWIIALLVFLLGVLIRHWFNSRHAGTGNPHWTWAASAVIFLVMVWLSAAGAPRSDASIDLVGDAGGTPTASAQRLMNSEGFDAVLLIVQTRCTMCHAREPVWEGIRWAPKGVSLETPADFARHAREVYLQAGMSSAMPPANVTGITAEERLMLIDWYEAAR